MKLEFISCLAGLGRTDYSLAHLLHGGRGAAIGAFATVLRRHFGRGLQAQGNFLVGSHADVLRFASHLVFRGIKIVAK